MTLPTGTDLAGYRIDRVIGEGGMSVVYLAEHRSDGARVALKVLRSELARNHDFRHRFLRESRFVTSLDNPHVVTVHDAGEADGLLYIAMDYIPGTDLHTLLTAGSLEPGPAVAILQQVGSALDAAHDVGLLHRDVKPGNVLVSSGGGDPPHCYLTDFGLSKNTTRESVALTAPGDFVGTLFYTAPEEILGKQLDRRADVYSLGCLLYECLAARPPFSGDTDVDVIRAHIESDPPKLSRTRIGAPPGLDAVIAKAMAKEPADRYPTCGHLMAAAAEAIEAAGLAAVVGTSTPVPGPPGKLRLRVTVGNAEGMEIQVDDELLIGRRADGAGRLAEDAEISRRHARVVRTGDGGFAIEDLGSRNGTFVNGRKIESRQGLFPGDRIELGATQLVVQGNAPGTPPGAQRSSSPGEKPELPGQPAPGPGLDELLDEMQEGLERALSALEALRERIRNESGRGHPPRPPGSGPARFD